MFDLNAKDGTVRKNREADRLDQAPVTKSDVVKASKLDSNEMTEMFRRLQDYYLRELDRQRENRIAMAEDEDFYDGIQWSPEDAEVLRDRGQMPLVYNVISTSVDWILGSEKRTRTDFKILPRTLEDAKPSERKTQLMKYLSDTNRSKFHVSRSFENAVVVGLGWQEDGFDDGDGDEPLYHRYESWRNMLFDSSASELDLEDSRYIFRSKWLDIDIAIALAPNRKETIEAAATQNDHYTGMSHYGDDAMDAKETALEQGVSPSNGSQVFGYSRRRVRVVEAWFKAPVEVDVVSGGMFSGEIYDEFSPGHQKSVADEAAALRKKTKMVMHVAIFVSTGLIWFSKSPYRHNKYPFTPVWGKRRGSDGLPYGIIRTLKDMQVDINKRASKALHILSTSKTVMDEGAVEDLEEFIEEVSRPDAVIVKKQGFALDINVDRDLSQYHVEMMNKSMSMIQSASGVTDELLARKTNAVSGIAITKRQEQGSLATSRYFDNLLLATQIRGEKQLSLIEQFMTDQKQFRITNSKDEPEFIQVNDGLPENDITQSKADFIISETDWRDSVRQAQVEALFELMAKLAPASPQVVMATLDLLVESMDIPNRDEIVKRIRQLTGVADPNQTEPTPDEVAKAQQAQMQAEMQAKTIALQMEKVDADTKLQQAKTAEIEARVASINMETQHKSVAAATAAVSVPGIGSIADGMLHEAGYQSRTEKEKMIADQQAQAAAQQAAAQQQPQQPPPQQQAADVLGIGAEPQQG